MAFDTPKIRKSEMPSSFKKIACRAVIASTVSLACTSHALADGQSATATATASATIILPIAIAKTGDLVFGKLAVGATGGTVAVSAADAVTIAGTNHTITQPASDTGSPAAAAFTVTGEPNMTYAITLPADGTITLTSGGNSMAVNGFTSSLGATGTLTGGTQALKVGATLSVADSQASGSYTGSFSVTVAYN
jgi:Domain of unknown function (DUF4402)